jgi:hypothetical protein
MSYWDKKMQQGKESRPALPALPPMPNPTPLNQRYNTPPTQPRTPVYTEETHCPECGSGNYGGAQGSQMKRCFDCNYGGTYRNPSQGLPTAMTDGPVKAATQVPSGGYNPQQVIGHI